jgi:hypothetical protein
MQLHGVWRREISDCRSVEKGAEMVTMAMLMRRREMRWLCFAMMVDNEDAIASLPTRFNALTSYQHSTYPQ